MKSDNIVQQKSFAYAIRIVNAYKYLTVEKKEFVLSEQEGTSLLNEADELCRILGKIQITLKARNS